jgi:NCS2 family nucleobase:cation symporter-2
VKKPANLIYGAEEIPPAGVTFVSGLQHVGLISIFLLFPLLVFRDAGLAAAELNNVLSLSMLAMGVGAWLSALRLGPLGSGFLCPPVFSAFYLSPSLLALKTGGLPLLFGMTLFAGFFEALMSRVQRHLRAYFPPEIAGLLVLLIGVNVGAIGVNNVLGISRPTPSGLSELVVAAVTLGSMVTMAVWGGGVLKMFSALLGMMLGSAAAGVSGVLTAADLDKVATAPWVSIPSLAHLGWRWDAAMVIPFAIGALAACLKNVGCVTTCQKINDADWVRPDMRSMERGVLADAAGTFAAGLLGTVGVNSSPTSIGVSNASGVTSRRVAYAIAGIFVVLAFLPKVAGYLAITPSPVIGAALLFAACYVFINGLQIISSRLFDARRTFVLGLSFMAGMAVDIYPGYFAQFAGSLQPILGSSLVLGVVCATVLNLIFRLGVRKVTRLSVKEDEVDATAIEDFMETHGAAWGARRDVIDRATFNLMQSIETIVEGCEPQGPLEVEATFDEFNLDIRVSYSGPPLELPDKRPTNEEIMESDEGQRRLAGFMLRRYADRVAASHRGGRSTILFHFDH